MSRTIKGKKPTGDYDFWTARPGNKHGGAIGPYAKKLTHQMERAEGKKEARNQQQSRDIDNEYAD